MARIGSMRCPVAALSSATCDVTDAAVTLSSGGQLGYRCHKCGASGWLPKGSRAYKAARQLVNLDEGAEVPGAAAAPAAAAPAPAARAPAAPGSTTRQLAAMLGALPSPIAASTPAPTPKPARAGFSMFSKGSPA